MCEKGSQEERERRKEGERKGRREKRREKNKRGEVVSSWEEWEREAMESRKKRLGKYKRQTLTYFSEETKDSFFYRLFQNIYFWEEFSRPEILIQSEELDSQVTFPWIAESEAGLQLSLGRN